MDPTHAPSRWEVERVEKAEKAGAEWANGKTFRNRKDLESRIDSATEGRDGEYKTAFKKAAITEAILTEGQGR